MRLVRTVKPFEPQEKACKQKVPPDSCRKCTEMFISLSLQHVGGTSSAKSSGTSQYIKSTLCHVRIRHVDKSSLRLSNRDALCVRASLRVQVLVRAYARNVAHCHRVMKHPASRTVFVLTEEIPPRPRYSHTVNKDTTHRLSQTGSAGSLESQNKRGSEELIKDSAHVRLGSRCKSEVNSSRQQCISDRANFLTCYFPDTGRNLSTRRRNVYLQSLQTIIILS